MIDSDNFIGEAQRYLLSAASAFGDTPAEGVPPERSDALALAVVGTGLAVLASGHAIATQLHLLRKVVGPKPTE